MKSLGAKFRCILLRKIIRLSKSENQTYKGFSCSGSSANWATFDKSEVVVRLRHDDNDTDDDDIDDKEEYGALAWDEAGRRVSFERWPEE